MQSNKEIFWDKAFYIVCIVKSYNVKVIYVCIHMDEWDSLMIYGGVGKSNDISQTPNNYSVFLNIYEQVPDVGQQISLHTN